MLMVILGVSDRIYLQVLVRDSGIRQSNIAKEVSGVNGLVDRLYRTRYCCPFLSGALDRRVSDICHWLPKTKVSTRRALKSSPRTQVITPIFLQIAKESGCLK